MLTPLDQTGHLLCLVASNGKLVVVLPSTRSHLKRVVGTIKEMELKRYMVPKRISPLKCDFLPIPGKKKNVKKSCERTSAAN